MEALLACGLGHASALRPHRGLIHYRSAALCAARNEPGAGAPVDVGVPSPKINSTHFGVLFIFGGATRNRTGDEGFADPCLTAWLWRRWSGKRGSNPPPQPWQGCALPNELFPHKKWCLRVDLNHRHRDFQSLALPTELPRHIGDPEGARTPDLQRDRLAY